MPNNRFKSPWPDSESKTLRAGADLGTKVDQVLEPVALAPYALSTPMDPPLYPDRLRISSPRWLAVGELIATDGVAILEMDQGITPLDEGFVRKPKDKEPKNGKPEGLKKRKKRKRSARKRSVSKRPRNSRLQSPRGFFTQRRGHRRRPRWRYGRQARSNGRRRNGRLWTGRPRQTRPQRKTRFIGSASSMGVHSGDAESKDQQTKRSWIPLCGRTRRLPAARSD